MRVSRGSSRSGLLVRALSRGERCVCVGWGALCRNSRQVQAHDKAAGLGVVRGGTATVPGGNAGYQGQPQARAAGVRIVGTPEAVEHVGQLAGCDARAVVGHFQGDGVQVHRRS